MTQTVWITGAGGFIGRHLVNTLLRSGHTVLGLGHGLTPGVAPAGLAFSINGDIEEPNLRQLLDHSAPPDAIYHLAGGSSVGLSLQTPTEDFRRTVVSTATLLEWIRANAPQTRLVLSSSAAVYGNTSAEYIQEHACYTPYSPYGFHKRSAELLCESYAQTFGLNIAIVRLFSVYGPGLRKQLLWDICNRLQQSPEQLTLHGSGNEIRDWLYVEDAARLLNAAATMAAPTPWIVNGGTGVGTNVREVATLLCEGLGKSPKLHFTGQQRPGDPFRLVADPQQLNAIEFVPSHSLTSGLQAYAHWFNEFQFPTPIVTSKL